MPTLRQLTIQGEKAVGQAVETARAEMAEMPDIVRVYYASGLLQVALATLTEGVDQEVREAIVRDILGELTIKALN